MDKFELAALLNGREYRREITPDEAAQAKAAGLVVVYGASDDLTEFDGAIHDEQSAYEGALFRITPKGLLPEWESFAEDGASEAVFEAYFEKKRAGFRVLWAEWAPSDEPGLSWRYKTEIPHATFNIMEDGDVYCRGIVFALADV